MKDNFKSLRAFCTPNFLNLHKRKPRYDPYPLYDDIFPRSYSYCRKKHACPRYIKWCISASHKRNYRIWSLGRQNFMGNMLVIYIIEIRIWLLFLVACTQLYKPLSVGQSVGLSLKTWSMRLMAFSLVEIQIRVWLLFLQCNAHMSFQSNIRRFFMQLPQKELTELKFSILVIVTSDKIVELPDILFDSIGDDQNLIFHGQD